MDFHGDHDLAGSLGALAGRIDPQATGIAGLRRLSGGAMQDIWRFDLLSETGSSPLVLRRAPPGHPPSNATISLPTEALIMRRAAAGSVPAPSIRYVLTPDDHLGEGFIMEFVAGETLGGRIVKDARFSAARSVMARQCGEILARIHAIDLTDLRELRPASAPDLLAQWRDAYHATSGPRPVFAAAFAWLVRHAPPPSRICLVHGDFRNGNLIVGEDGVRAVLDWELAHAGDPLEDLGWLCVNSWRFGRPEKSVGGFGDVDDLIAGYEQAGGAPVDRAALAWWQMFGTLRWGVMCAGMVASFRGTDPAVERAVICRRASETEIDLLTLLAA